MNDEIKEILEQFNKIFNMNIEEDESSIDFSVNECKQILDYITNLQQENEEFKARWKDAKVIIKDDKSLIMNTNAYNCLEDYKSKVEKAVEYIDTWVFDEYSIAIQNPEDEFLCSTDPEAVNKLLNILQGEDNDN